MNNFYTGVVEDRTTDPLKLGRCKVRIVGVHTENKAALPTKDLPWALVMQPTTSAAMSGIGYAPVGPVEGSLVVVMFTDEDMQQPIIIGTVGGIPQDSNNTVGTTVNDSGINNKGVVTDTGTIDTKSGDPLLNNEKSSSTEKPTSLSLSEAGKASIKSLEGLASLDKNKTVIGRDSLPGTTLLYSYLDTKNIWTIGWGSTVMPSGIPVTQDSIITKEQADALFYKLLADTFEPGLKRNIKVPLTQSMYDSIVSMMYNMGVSGFMKTEVATSLNAGKYEEAAAFIPAARNNNGTLSGRRSKEKSLFLKDGIPTAEGDLKDIPETESTTATPADITENPVVLKQQQSSVPENLNKVDENGFRDPNNVYPRWVNEADTHRLARSESVDKTIVFGKESARARSVPTATGSTWTQPPIPYNAKYPYNHVFATESGHVEEWDDTAGNERRHSYHKSGTFHEIDVNGTRVTRIVGDDYEILERNGNVLIKGTCNITIQGNSNVRIENDSNIQVLGNANMNVTGNMTTSVAGNYRVKVGGQFSVDASRIDWNSGKDGGIATPTEGATGVPSFSTLTTPSRATESNSSYETPEDGPLPDDVATKNEQDPDSTAAGTTTEEKQLPEKQAASIPYACDEINTMTEFTSGYRLTKRYTLGDVCKGSSGIPSGVNYGMPANAIVCNLKMLTENCIEKIKDMYPNMLITNTWRSEAVNTKVGGSKTSDHLKGCAADIQLSGFSRQQYLEAAAAIQNALPAFKQIILEYKGSTTWIHVSFDVNNNKMESLTMDASLNKTLSRGKFVLA